MKPLTRTISSTGNNSRAFTFVEIMVALVILSAGIVMIYKSFLLCVDHLTYLSCRLHASQMVESKISEITRSYQDSQGLYFDRGPQTESVEINHRWVDFNYDIDMDPVSGLDGAYRMKISLAWHDGKRLLKLYREALLVKL